MTQLVAAAAALPTFAAIESVVLAMRLACEWREARDHDALATSALLVETAGRSATPAALRACASAGLAPKLLLLLPWPSQKPPPGTSAATTAQATGLRAVCSSMPAIAASDAGFR